MSTILKTLRKLEKEKSTLDQKLDIKGMLLKEEAAYPKLIQLNGGKSFLLITSMLVGLLILVGITFYDSAQNEEIKTTKSSPKKKRTQQAIPSAGSFRPRAFEGVPMGAILNQEFTKQPNPKKKFPSIKPLPDDVSQKTTSRDVVEIENLIRASTTSAKKNLVMQPSIQSGYIPGIKIKGIIFFDKGSSSNHIIAATESSSNVKLRVGEVIQDAVLKSIHPNHVIFLYRDQLIEVVIGR